ncbi:MAG: hypothetical protein M3Q08_00030 [Pseudomonadota bacterium]|nr:hypothetical protein [Pseudomonadota bacterium]
MPNRRIPARPSQAKQIDVALRARYPFLKTRLFQTGHDRYLIWFDAHQLDASLIAREFDQEICFASMAVTLNNVLPTIYEAELEPLRDRDIGNLAGQPLSVYDLRLLLAGRLPDLPPLTTSEPDGGDLLLFFPRALADHEAAAVTKIARDVLPEWDIRFAVAETEAPPASENVLRILPPSLRPWREAYVEEDEAYWHDHAEAIFAGNIGPDSVVDRTALGSSCLLNPQLGPTIDLRQALLCYDTVLLQPPLAEETEQFLERQTLSREDVALLARCGRLKLLLAQPEERCDTKLISQIVEGEPSAIIPRRRAAAVVAADLVATADDYIFANDGLLEATPVLAEAVAERSGTSAKQILDMLLWPISARRSSFLALQDAGLLGIGHFGVSTSVARELSAYHGRDVQLEATVFAMDVHAAHAFKATLIPADGLQSAWTGQLAYMGARLNFYRAFNDRLAPAWVGNEQRRASGHILLPNIPLFDFNPVAPLEDLLVFTARASDRRKGFGLISRLSMLPEDERAGEMERLARELYRREVRKSGRGLALDTTSNLVDVATAVVGSSFPPFVAAGKLFRFAREQSRRIAAMDRFWDALDRDLPERFRPDADLDFLSKMSRVAELHYRNP